MNFFSKLVIAILIILSVFYVKDNFFKDGNFSFPLKQKEIVAQKESPQQTAQTHPKKPAKLVEENTVKIYFAKEKNDSTSLKYFKRPIPKNTDKLQYAIAQLLDGPKISEKSLGVFSEIPKGTRILAIKKDNKSIIIDLSEDFQYGGGTQSQYTRIQQLIKTVLETKPQKPVYLYLNGQKAEVIGGEGLILNQPLSENSLND